METKKSSNALKDYLEYGIIFLAALAELALLAFYGLFSNHQMINCLLFIIPTVTIIVVYFLHRRYHYRYIYTQEELEKQHRG